MNLKKKECPYLKIKDMDELDKPREKLLNLGASKLSNAELIGILIRSGVKNCSAIDLAKYILHSSNYDLNTLANLSITELKTIKGIGEAKAISIISALELSKRLYLSPNNKTKPTLNSSKLVYEYIKLNFYNLTHEQLWAIFLTQSNKPIKKIQISIGGFSEVNIDCKILFKRALSFNASKIILIHNHPSGDTNPSKEDIQITKKIMYAALLLDLKLIDHLIYTNTGYFSFADSGYMS